MVGDYLWFAGWRDIEIVELSDGVVKSDGGGGGGESQQQAGGMGALMRSLGLDFSGGRCDPLWVVRGRKVSDDESTGDADIAETTAKV